MTDITKYVVFATGITIGCEKSPLYLYYSIFFEPSLQTRQLVPCPKNFIKDFGKLKYF